MKIGLTETMLRGELWAGMDWVLQTAISVPSSTIKRYQTQKRIVRCHDHRYFWFHCHILNEQNFDYIKIKSKRKINQHFSLNDFGIDSAEQTHCIKKVRKVISRRSLLPCLLFRIFYCHSLFEYRSQFSKQFW